MYKPIRIKYKERFFFRFYQIHCCDKLNDKIIDYCKYLNILFFNCAFVLFINLKYLKDLFFFLLSTSSKIIKIIIYDEEKNLKYFYFYFTRTVM